MWQLAHAGRTPKGSPRVAVGTSEHCGRVLARNERTPGRSAFWREKWLNNCQGFRVDSSAGRIGYVKGLRASRSGKPELLEVRAGLLGRRLLLIPVEQIGEIAPEQRRILLGGPPQLVEQD